MSKFEGRRQTLPLTLRARLRVSLDVLFLLSRFRASDRRDKGGRGRRAAGRGHGAGRQRSVSSTHRSAGGSPRSADKGVSNQKRASGGAGAGRSEITAVSRQNSVALYIDDFQRTQIELGELMIRVGYYFVL